MRNALAALLKTRSAGRIALLVGLLICLALGEGMALYLLLSALTAFVGIAAVDAGALGRFGISLGLPLVIAAFLAVSVIVSALQYWTRREIASIRLDFLHQRRMDLFQAIRRARWLALADRKASAMRYGFNELTEAISYSLDQALQALVSAALLGTGLVFAFAVDARITAIMFAAALAAAIPFRLAERRATRVSADAASRLAALYQRLDQSLADVKFLKFLGASDSAANRVERDSTEQIDALNRMFTGAAATGALYSVASSAVMALALLVAWWTGVQAHTLLLLALIAGRLFPRVTTLVGIFRRLAELDARWIEFDTFLNELNAEVEAPNPQALHAEPVARVAIDKVSFAYRASGKEILSDISFELARGKAIGLVGLTGAGKTTTIDLVCGLLQPNRGEIRLDGRLLEPELGEAWRERIALVDQDSAVLSASLRENLTLRNAAATDTELAAACATVGLGSLLASLPDGLDTFLGDNGRLLSRGERQRVSLARALLQRPDLLILDEATASLNPLDEASIIAAIQQRKTEFATLTVAHRVSALLWVDEVMVLADGRIAERGNPLALLANASSMLYRMSTKSTETVQHDGDP